MKTKFIGIDVSKETLDICILSITQDSFVIKNNKKEILKCFKSHLDDENETHVCIEKHRKIFLVINGITTGDELLLLCS